MTPETLSAIEVAVKKGINGQLNDIHQQISSNESKRLQDHIEVTNQIEVLSKQIQPWNSGADWIKQLMRGIIYLGAPAGGAFAIYKFVKIFIR